MWVQRYHEAKIRRRYAGIFHEYKRNLHSLRYDIVWVVRRYTISLCCIGTGFQILEQLQFWYYIQINIQLWSTGIVLSYITWHSPFKKKTINIQEIFNEIMVMACTYMLFCFTDWTDEIRRYQVGDAMVYMLGVNVAFNFTVLLYAQFNYVKSEIRRRRHESKVKKALQMQRLYRDQVAWYEKYNPEALNPKKPVDSVADARFSTN